MGKHSFHHKTFKQHTQRANLLDFAARGAVDKGAAMGGLLDETFFHKLLNRLAHWNAADPQTFSEVALDQACPQGEFAGANGIA
jgi:hypothetical protein